MISQKNNITEYDVDNDTFISFIQFYNEFYSKHKENYKFTQILEHILYHPSLSNKSIALINTTTALSFLSTFHILV